MEAKVSLGDAPQAPFLIENGRLPRVIAIDKPETIGEVVCQSVANDIDVVREWILTRLQSNCDRTGCGRLHRIEAVKARKINGCHKVATPKCPINPRQELDMLSQIIQATERFRD